MNLKQHIYLALQLALVVYLGLGVSFAQLKTTIDTTEVKIGEQITLSIELEVDTSTVVVFPEGQPFNPLEVIESFPVDTTRIKAKYRLLKQYDLTQFNSGTYTIPRQPVAVGDKTLFTDSIHVEIRAVEVDSTKQGLYDIKPLIVIEKPQSYFWLYFLIIIGILALVGFIIYWFLWRKKPLTEDEKIALLPPYERAKFAIKTLKEQPQLLSTDIKGYYSDLTLAIRKYLDEKVYDKAMESTTNELIAYLQLLSDGNRLKLRKDSIENLEIIFKRADLVKFAKSRPDIELAKLDTDTVLKEIDRINTVLPEPDEEEKRLSEAYRIEEERKAKRRKIVLTSGIAFMLLVLTYLGFSTVYGFRYVFDKVTFNSSLQLLEKEWVNSAYGAPPVYISTPEVLARQVDSVNNDAGSTKNATVFTYNELGDLFFVAVQGSLIQQKQAQDTTTTANQSQPEVIIGEIEAKAIKNLENKGATDILLKREVFVTPNKVEGLKTFGTFIFKDTRYQYNLLHFVTSEIVQKILLVWKEEGSYSDDIAERIMSSIELNKNEQ